MTWVRVLYELAGRRGLALPADTHPEPLAALAYPVELEIKRAALAAFWHQAGMPGEPDPVLPAPQPRGYRTTTKRRAVAIPKGVALGFPGAPPLGSRLALSALDPLEHLAVYEFLVERLALPAARPFAEVLTWAIVRGTPSALALILNLRRFDARVVRAAKQLGEALQETALGVRGAFLYLDPSGSDYYLEARRPAGTLNFKRLFGPEWLQVEVLGLRLRFPVTVFSQVNGPMLETMATMALGLLAPLEEHPLADLYCGYGLFSIIAATKVPRVTGVDADGPAILAARANAVHLGLAGRTRFLAGHIDGEFLATRLRPPASPEVVILDPPRQGTAPGVAAALAARRPARVLHICCGTDEIPRELAAWQQAGYALRRAVPLDLFAGTANLETMLLLGRSGSDVRGSGGFDGTVNVP